MAVGLKMWQMVESLFEKQIPLSWVSVLRLKQQEARGLVSGGSKRTGLWPGKNKILMGPGFLYSEIQDLSKILYIKL